MRVGLIPPTPELKNFDEFSTFHLVLNHMLDHYDYASYYGDARLRGHFCMLDNSAHEFGAGNHHEYLFEQAQIHKFQEVVLPDELFSVSGTTKRTWDAVEWLKEHHDFVPDSLCIVPQGKDIEEFRVCRDTLLRTLELAHLHTKVTLGLSKDFEVWSGGLHQVLEYDIYPYLERGDVNSCHMLGWGRDLWELSRIARDFPLIRSIDSAKPFVYAANNIQLEYGVNVIYPRRNREYFDTPLSHNQFDIAIKNVELFIRVAQGEEE